MRNRYVFGKWEEDRPLTAADASRILDKAREARKRLAAYPTGSILEVLGKVGERWADPKYPRRRRAESVLPGITGFSKAMVRKGLRELAWTLNPELLRRKIDTELTDKGPAGPFWEPLGVVLHVLAGNVFVGAAGALVEGLITRNVSILKTPTADPYFLPELIRSIAENDADGVVSRSLAAVAYRSDQQDVIRTFKASVDGIAVWGAEGSVRAYGQDLPARTRLIVFGPKLSIALVTKRGLKETKVNSAAERLAAELTIWDQSACTAPQACYVEGEAQARALVDALPRALEAEAKRLPPGAIDGNSAVEIQKLRSVAEVAQARGEGALRCSPSRVDWTVILDRDQTLEPSPLHRTIRIIPFKKTEDVLAQVESLRGYIQTVGLLAPAEDAAELAPRLARAGALRLLELGGMAAGEIDDPHDGRYDLPLYMNLVVSRLPGSGSTLHMARTARERLIDERLRTLIAAARRSPFYAKRLKGLRVERAQDLRRVPLLTREQMESNMPPQGHALGTTPSWTGGYVARSGGSTGEPKFSVYDRADWDAMIDSAVEVFRAMGLDESDRLGNFMLAGDLYGSFVSFDHINARLGLTSFAFAGTSTPETFVDVWRQFGLTAIQGIPSHILPFLKKAKALEPGLSVRKFVYGGIPLAPSDYDWLKTALKVERVSSVIGANDGGQIAYQCPSQRGALHHTIDEFNLVEVVDGRGRPVRDGSVGRVVITSLLKLAFPLIRYDLGDLGRIVPKPCGCGGAARVLEHLGRADDTVCVGMMNVRYSDFQRVLSRFPVSALQLAATNDRKAEAVILRVETDRPADGLARRMRSALLASMNKVRDRLASGELAALEVELHRPGGLPRNPRTGKLRSLVDERK